MDTEDDYDYIFKVLIQQTFWISKYYQYDQRKERKPGVIGSETTAFCQSADTELMLMEL